MRDLYRCVCSRAGRFLLGAVLGIWGGMAVQADGDEGYEGGRGLITLEGPSGMFINPTSGTLPKQASTLQYCVFFPNNKTDVVGHGLMAAYGVTDELEVGGIGTLLDIKPSERGAGGPFARYRLTRDEGGIPQVSVGAYSRLGDTRLNKVGVFLAGYKRVPIDEGGFIRSLGFHAGIKELWFDDNAAVSDSLSGYGGVEAQFPLRLYLVGEVTTKDSDVNAHVPYSVGIQWRAPGIAMSLAGIQNGGTDDLSFYYGIGFSSPF